MHLCCKYERTLLPTGALGVSVDGCFLGEIRGRKPLVAELAERPHYFIHIGNAPSAELTVLLPDGTDGTVTLRVKREKKGFSLSVDGGTLESLSLKRILDAMSDESLLPLLCEWERNVFFALLYAELSREDVILESVHVLEIRDALFAVGDRATGARLSRAIEACELPLPLDPQKKLSPEEQTAMVESYHVLWLDEERAPRADAARAYVTVMDYAYQMNKQKN